MKKLQRHECRPAKRIVTQLKPVVPALLLPAATPHSAAYLACPASVAYLVALYIEAGCRLQQEKGNVDRHI
jgi:hypothetical protein